VIESRGQRDKLAVEGAAVAGRHSRALKFVADRIAEKRERN